MKTVKGFLFLMFFTPFAIFLTFETKEFCEPDFWSVLVFWLIRLGYSFSLYFGFYLFWLLLKRLWRLANRPKESGKETIAGEGDEIFFNNLNKYD